MFDKVCRICFSFVCSFLSEINIPRLERSISVSFIFSCLYFCSWGMGGLFSYSYSFWFSIILWRILIFTEQVIYRWQCFSDNILVLGTTLPWCLLLYRLSIKVILQVCYSSQIHCPICILLLYQDYLQDCKH